MTKLQEVRAKVIAAVPEIVELKFGCVVRHTPPKSLGIDYRGIYIHEGKASKWRINQRILFPAMGSEPAYSVLLPSDHLEIIGRPITLADVLRAIGATRDNSAANLGGFTRDLLNNGWNLSLPLDEQSEEVIEFLHRILCA